MKTDAGPRFLDAATIQERIDDIDLLEHRLVEDPADLIASERLEGIYRSRKDWTNLIQLLLDRAELSTAPAENAKLLCQVATIYTDQLGEPDAALVVLQTAFANDPTSSAIADAMDQAAYATGEWMEIVDTYILSAAELQHDRPEVASELWLRVACATVMSCGDWEAVSDALERVSTLDPRRARSYLDRVETASSAEVLESLALVCARIEEWDRMARVLSKAIAVCTDERYTAKLHHQLAELNRALGDGSTAEWHYVEALRLDPSRNDTRDRLVLAYKERGEFRKAAQLLEEQYAVAENRVDKVELGYRAAALYREVDESSRAFRLCKATLEADPDHEGAAIPLAERYWKEQRWQELEPIIDMLVRRSGRNRTEGTDELQLRYRAAHCAKQLGKHAKARDSYDEVLHIDGAHLAALLESADVHVELQEWSRAYELYSAALIGQRRSNCSSTELAHTLFMMGQTRERSGDIDGALTLYESAHDAGKLEEAIEAATELYTQRGNWGAVVQAKRTLLEGADEERQVELLAEIASITSRKLGDPHGAIQIYRDAQRIDADNREVLHQLVEHYSAAECWRDAVRSIARIAELEEDAVRRGKYYQAAGTICRHHLGGDEAVSNLNKALDCFFLEAEELPESLRAGCMKAFSDIGRVLYEAREWKELERNYRKMIKRMKPEDSELAELWHGLGQVYRKHLNLRESAINSFEVASELDQKRATNHRILIDLYAEAGADKLEKAIERRVRLVQQNPMVAEHYSAMRSLYLKTKQYDKVWCACRAVEFLGKADSKERDFYRRRRPEGIIWPRSPLTEEMWSQLRHQEENPAISSIFATVSEVIAAEGATSARKLGLRNDETPAYNHLRRLFSSTGYALGVRQMELFMQPEIHGDILLANIKTNKEFTPAFAIGRALYDGQSVQQIVHSLARTLTYVRPHYYLRLCLPTLAELESVFLAAAMLSRSDVPVPPQLGSWVNGSASVLRKRLHPTWHTQLARAVDAFVREGKSYDLERWGHAVDATARRAGLLITGNLEAAVAGFAREPLFTAGPSHEKKVQDLLVHSVSETHFELRRQLGLAIK